MDIKIAETAGFEPAILQLYEQYATILTTLKNFIFNLGSYVMGNGKDVIYAFRKLKTE